MSIEGVFQVVHAARRQTVRAAVLILCAASMAQAQARSPRQLTAAEQAQRLDLQRSLAGRQAVKISVSRSGWYRIGQAQLVAAGLGPNINPHNLRLFADGVEQPLRVITTTGKAEGRFQSNDAIEFYGTGLDTPFTDAHVYWLTADTPGLRVPVDEGRTSRVATSLSFPFTVERRDRKIFFAALKNNGGNKYFGDVIGSWGPADEAIEVAELDRNAPGTARLEVTVQGVTNDPGSNPDHHVGVSLNGVEVGELQFDGQGVGVGTFDVAHSAVTSGTNTVSLTARGGDLDITILDSLRLTYSRLYTADGDALRFTADAQQPVSVSGFSRGDIRLIDITDAASPRELVGTVRPQGTGYQITALPQGSGIRTLLAFTGATVGAPDAVRANAPSNWSAKNNDADYVIITHRDFVDAMQPLKALRAAQGYHVAMVDVDDLYDEFSFGEKTPQAIKDFVVRAHAEWHTAPRFLVLVGNASADPRNYLGMGEVDYVPVQLVNTAFLEVPADDWFADSDGDGRADLAAVGRLPARDTAQAAGMVAKIRGYEAATDGSWTRDVLFVADANDNESNFEASTRSLEPLVPAQYATHEIFRGPSGTDAARTELLGRLNDGQLIVNYFGHGSVDLWNNDVLTGSDAPAFTNGVRLPFVVAMTCLNGYFHSLFPEESLAEALVRAPNGGAIAVWASSTLTSPAGQVAMDRELFRLLFSGRYKTLGEAVGAAKQATGDGDVRRSWILFGDPAIRLKGLPDAPLTDNSAQPVSIGREAAAPAHTPSAPQSEADTQESPVSADLSLAETPKMPTWQVVSGDLNADRLADFVFYQPDTGAWLEAVSRVDGTFEYGTGRWSANLTVRSADLNADGRADVFLYNRQTGAWFGAVSDGAGAFAYQSGTWSPNWNVDVGDFNGDRLIDVLLFDSTGSGQLGLNGGAAGFAPITGPWSIDWTLRVADLNGDWFADLLLYNPTTGAWMEGFGDGTGQFKYQGGAWSAKQQLHVADFNGDGSADVLLYDAAKGRWQVGISTTAGGFAFSSGTWAAGWTVATGDLSGDGRADVLLYDPISGRSLRCLTVRPGEFTSVKGTLPRGTSIIGAAR